MEAQAGILTNMKIIVKKDLDLSNLFSRLSMLFFRQGEKRKMLSDQEIDDLERFEINMDYIFLGSSLNNKGFDNDLNISELYLVENFIFFRSFFDNKSLSFEQFIVKSRVIFENLRNDRGIFNEELYHLGRLFKQLTEFFKPEDVVF